MRLICTINDAQSDEDPYVFSLYLRSIGIANECEEVIGAHLSYHIWAIDEDLIAKAQEIYAEYHANPLDPRFRVHRVEVEEPKETPDPSPKPQQKTQQRRLLSPSPFGKLSVIILLTVIIIFVWAQTQRKTIMPPNIPGVALAPILSSVDEALTYDYPHYFQLRDDLLKIYTAKDIKEKIPPSAEALTLIQKIHKTSFWGGIYDRIIKHHRNAAIPLLYDGPMFEKISQGEVWRVFTPCLVHFDILHIFFNVLWFIMLGNQIEHRLGSFRYLLLILLAAIFSNSAQYLMSGSFFMGLSGVVCGFAGFIWARQQIAPWEGYLLNRVTLIFLAIFVIGMLGLQVAFFILQLLGKFEHTIAIANTAHLTGATVGYLLGRLRLFATHRK